MTINRSFFYSHLKEKLYPKGLRDSQIEGHDAVLDHWEKTSASQDDRWLAYMFGTAYHETGRTLQPVRETFAVSDDQAITRLERAWQKGKLPWVKEPYWRKDAEGKSWFGRGLVQLTHRDNYVKAGRLVKIDIVSDPNQALDLSISINIMFQGMERGIFTNRKLSDFFNNNVEQWRDARRIINGTESADEVASYARSYYAAISYTTSVA